MRSGLRKIYLLNKTVDRNTNYDAFGSIIPKKAKKSCFYFSRMFALPVIELLLLLLLRIEAATKQEFWLAYE